MKKAPLILLTLLIFPLLIYSQENNNFYIHPFSNAITLSLEGGTSYTNSDFSKNRFDYIGRGMLEYFFYSNNIGTFGLRLYGGISYLGGEGGLNFEPTKFSSLKTLKTDLYYLGGGYSYTVSANEIFFPYIFLGLTYIQFYPRGNDNIRISDINQREFANDDINYVGELGTRILFHENISLNLSGTVNINPSDNLDGIYANQDNDIYYTANIGLSYYFLYAKDSDGDGVDDSEDMCPNTPPYIHVNDFGCPLDSDNDGVPDNKDICPDTPPTVVVDKNGCPADLDEDGVPDQIDQCLYTPKGTIVDSVGCPVPIPEDTSYNRTVISNFSFAKSEIPSASFKILNDLANYMLEHTDLRWEIEGHCDDVSVNCDLNYQLSVQRAANVYNFIINKGVNPKSIEIIGFSEYHPIADNNSETGRAQNRRVEIIKLK